MYENKHRILFTSLSYDGLEMKRGSPGSLYSVSGPNIFKARQKKPKTRQGPACAARVLRAGHVYPNNPLWQELAGNKWCRKCPRSLSVRDQQQSISLIFFFSINRASPEQRVPCLMQIGAGCVWNPLSLGNACFDMIFLRLKWFRKRIKFYIAINFFAFNNSMKENVWNSFY